MVAYFPYLSSSDSLSFTLILSYSTALTLSSTWVRNLVEGPRLYEKIRIFEKYRKGYPKRYTSEKQPPLTTK